MSVRVRSLFVAGTILAGSMALFAGSADLRVADAAQLNDKESIKSLLEQHADVNAPQGDGATALAWAVHHDDMESAVLLIKAGANVNAANDYGVTPLTLACTNKNATMVGKLLEAGANPNLAQTSGETPLMTCSKTGNAEAVKLLLSHGADVNARDTERGQTALMWAASRKHPEVVQALVDKKSDVNARSKLIDLYEPMIAITYSKNSHFPKSKGGFSPLMFAAQSGDVESAKILIAAGAGVDAGTPEDGTPLVVATQNGQEKVAMLLLDKGANPNATDGYGMTAMHWALQEGIVAIYGGKSSTTDRYWVHPNMPNLVKALLSHGGDANAQMKHDFMPYEVHRFARTMGNNLPQLYLSGMTPYMLASAVGDVGLMRTLVEGRANPKISTFEETSPLMVAAGVGREREDFTEEQRKGYLEAVKLNVLLGGDVNAKDKKGRTALHGATYLGAADVIEFLAAHGANLEAKDMYGQTAMTIAMGDPEGLVYRQLPGDAFDYSFRQPFKENKKVVETLLKLGAAPFTGKYRDRSAE